MERGIRLQNLTFYLPRTEKGNKILMQIGLVWSSLTLKSNIVRLWLDLIRLWACFHLQFFQIGQIGKRTVSYVRDNVVRQIPARRSNHILLVMWL